jgi:hypothetical protein
VPIPVLQLRPGEEVSAGDLQGLPDRDPEGLRDRPALRDGKVLGVHQILQVPFQIITSTFSNYKYYSNYKCIFKLQVHFQITSTFSHYKYIFKLQVYFQIHITSMFSNITSTYTFYNITRMFQILQVPTLSNRPFAIP